MSDGLSKTFIACGWIAAGVNCIGNLLVGSRVGGFGQPVLKLVDPRNGEEFARLTQGELTLALFVITYGIYRRSRVAALAMLVLFVTLKVVYYNKDLLRLALSNGDKSFVISFWVSSSVFVSLFVLGVIGTFAWHARHPDSVRQPGSA